MAETDKLRCLFRLDVAGRSVPVVPVFALKFLLYSVLVLALAALILDRSIIPGLETSGTITSRGWVDHNRRVNINNREKNLARPPSPVWRSKGIPAKQQKTKAKRILVMGDSYVWGDGTVNVNDLWWRQLARELARRGYHDVEVIAAGLSGDETRQQIEWARRIVPEYKPDLIVWGYVVDDPDEGLVPRGDAMPFDMSRLGEVLRGPMGSVLPRLADALVSLRERRRLRAAEEAGTYYGYRQWTLKLLEGESFMKYRRTVAALGEFQRSVGVPGFVVTLPNMPDVEYFRPRYAAVRPLFESAGMKFHDCLDDFETAYPGGRHPAGGVLAWGTNPANGHPGRCSTRFHARFTADIIERDYPEVLGPKTEAPVAISINDWMPHDLDPAEAVGQWRFTWPGDRYKLVRPVGVAHVQLNLEVPVALRSIRFEGRGVSSAKVWVTTYDEKLGFDTGELHSLGEDRGTSIEWNLQGAGAVNTIRIAADVDAGDRDVIVKLLQAGGGE